MEFKDGVSAPRSLGSPVIDYVPHCCTRVILEDEKLRVPSTQLHMAKEDRRLILDASVMPSQQMDPSEAAGNRKAQGKPWGVSSLGLPPSEHWLGDPPGEHRFPPTCSKQ